MLRRTYSLAVAILLFASCTKDAGGLLLIHVDSPHASVALQITASVAGGKTVALPSANGPIPVDMPHEFGITIDPQTIGKTITLTVTASDENGTIAVPDQALTVAAGKTVEVSYLLGAPPDLGAGTGDLGPDDMVASTDLPDSAGSQDLGPPQLILLAGQIGGVGNNEGIGSVARLSIPSGITFLDGELYVSDQFSLRPIDVATQRVSSLDNFPGQGPITSDGAHTLFFGSGAKVYSSDLSLSPTTFMLIPAPTCNSTLFTTIVGVAFAGGNVFVSDPSGFVCRMNGSTMNKFTTIAGTSGIAFDGMDTIYVPLPGSTVMKIKVSDNSTATLSINGSGSPIAPNYVCYLSGNLYVSDGNQIKKIDVSTGATTVLTGSTISNYVDGSLTNARFSDPRGIATDNFHTLFVSDHQNRVIRAIDLDQSTVSTIYGLSPHAGELDAVGTSALLTGPSALAYDASMQTAYFADSDNGHSVRHIRKLTLSDSRVTTLAAIGGGDIGAMIINQAGTMLYMIDPSTQTVETFDLQTNQLGANFFVAATANDMSSPSLKGLAINDDGTIFVSDKAGGLVHQFTAQGVPTTIPLTGAGSLTVLGTTLYASAENSPNQYHLYSADLTQGTPAFTKLGTVGFNGLAILANDGTSIFAADFSVVWKIGADGAGSKIVGTDANLRTGVVLGSEPNANLNHVTALGYAPNYGLLISDDYENSILLFTE